MSNVNSGVCVGGPLAGKTLAYAGATYTQWREADPIDFDGGGKTYNRVIGTYTFAAGSWTWTQVNQP
jgi:hypothetical protein